MIGRCTEVIESEMDLNLGMDWIRLVALVCIAFPDFRVRNPKAGVIYLPVMCTRVSANSVK